MNRGPFGTKIFSPERTGFRAAPQSDRGNPGELADDLSFEIDDLLPLVDTAVMLGLALVHNAQLEITDFGREFARADIDTSKKLFGELIAERAPLIKAILRALRATEDGTLREGFFLDLLRRGFSAEEARRQLDIAIDWGRYGELSGYDAESGELGLGSDPEKIGLCLRARGPALAVPAEPSGTAGTWTGSLHRPDHQMIGTRRLWCEA